MAQAFGSMTSLIVLGLAGPASDTRIRVARNFLVGTPANGLSAVSFDEASIPPKRPDLGDVSTRATVSCTRARHPPDGCTEGSTPTPVCVCASWYQDAYPDAGQPIWRGTDKTCRAGVAFTGFREGRLRYAAQN
jgi:hypothetical protein